MTITEAPSDIWAQTARAFHDPLGTLTNAPQLDLTQGVELYFDIVQRTIDANRELVGVWADLVGSLTAVVREQVEADGEHTAVEVVVDNGDREHATVVDPIIDDPATVDAR
jgi:hypothetical protein